MTQENLMDKLEAIASKWRAKPHLSNDHTESVEYGEVVNELKDRFGVSAEIKGSRDNSVDYQVVVS